MPKKKNKSKTKKPTLSSTQMDSSYRLEGADLTEMESWYNGRLGEAEVALKQKEDELNSIRSSFTQMDSFYKERLEEAGLILKQKEDELSSVKVRLTEMESWYNGRLGEAEAALKQKDNELNSVKQRLTGMEKNVAEIEIFYKQKLDEVRVAQKQKDRELKLIKDRMAAIAYLFKYGDTESMNNPASKTRLIEMYDKMKLQQWPKTKDQLKSRSIQSKVVQGLIQKTFRTAAGEANKKQQQIEEAFGLSKYNSGLTPQKVTEYRQLTVKNLQRALFHTNKEELLKSSFPELGGQYSEEVMVDLKPLMSECYWLSCLMSLNNPPLQPDWKNLVPSMDPWDIFPRNITFASVM